MKPGTFWQYNPIHNELQFSPFYMSESNLELYVKRLQQYKPEFLHGYPSAITILADYIAKYSLQSKIQPVKAIFCSSEACTPYQRSKMEQTFQCPVYPFYGQSERVAWAGECDEKNIFHTFPGYSFCEILTADSIPVKSGECGEITGTGFWNYSMPLIRYATDDTARLLEESSGKYYHTITLDQLHGRRKSGVYGKDNVWISSASLELYDSIFEYITAYQYYQREPGKLEILIVPNCNWQSNMADKLLASHRELLGDAMDMKVILTDDIPCTSGGKRLLIRQDYKPEALDA